MKTIIIAGVMHAAALRVAEQIASRGQKAEIISTEEAEQRGLNRLHPEPIPIKRYGLEPIPVVETPDMTGREARRERRKLERKKLKAI